MTILQKINILEWAYPDHFDYCLVEFVDDILLFTDKMGWGSKIHTFPPPTFVEYSAVCSIWVDSTNPEERPICYKGRGLSRFEAALTALCNLALDLPFKAKGQL